MESTEGSRWRERAPMRIVEHGEGKREGDGSAPVVPSKTESFTALRGQRRIHFNARAEQKELAFEGAESEGLSDLVDSRWGIEGLLVLRLRDIEGFAGLGRGGVELLAETRKLHDETCLVGLGPGDRCGRAVPLRADLSHVHIVTMGPRNFGGFVVQST
jgi:hypothetical protein